MIYGHHLSSHLWSVGDRTSRRYTRHPSLRLTWPAQYTPKFVYVKVLHKDLNLRQQSLILSASSAQGILDRDPQGG